MEGILSTLFAIEYVLVHILVYHYYFEQKAYKDCYEQARKTGFEIAKKRNELEKKLEDYYKSIKSAIRKFKK